MSRARLQLIPVPAKPDEIFDGRPAHELEFLPAALEVLETPPPPLARITALTLLGLLAAAIGWACIGKVDVVSVATGRLVPVGGGKVVQPLETGVVSAIHVKDGDVVRRGDVLIELEPTIYSADADRLAGEAAAADLEVARLKTVALGQPFHPPKGVGGTAIAGVSAQAAIDDRQSRLETLTQQINQHRAELESAKAEIDRLNAVIPIARNRTSVFEQLAAKGYDSKLQRIDAEEKQHDLEGSLQVQLKKIPELQALIGATERQRAQVMAEAAKTNLAALTEAQTKAASLSEQSRAARSRLENRTLRAPVDGAVQELAIHTVGGVVEPGQTLLRIAPSGDRLEVEARLSNKDIGFVAPGMKAQVKLVPFPFTKYGTLPATVLTVSRDAMVEQRQPNPKGQDPAAPQEEQAYLVRLRLDSDSIMVDGRRAPLTAGMMVSAEVKSDDRRIIEFLFSPLSRTLREAARER